MNKFKRIHWVGVIFLTFFLLVSLPQAQSADATATVPLTATAVVGASEAECPYTLTFKLAAVALHREDNKSQSLIDVEGVDLIDAGDLDLGWAPGMDTSLMLQNECYGIELRYLGLHQWDESKRDSDLIFLGTVTGSAKLKSALHNAELNLHWWPCANDRYSLLMGFRWLRLRDRLSLIEGTNIFLRFTEEGNSLSCRNDLWGGQVGVEGLLFGKRDQGFSIDGGVKAGVFANKIRNKASEYEAVYDLGELADFGSDSDSWNRTKTAFLSEVVLNANYAFTKNISMTVGYQFLYVNKVAVPVNDWASTQSVIFHGGRAGLNFVF
jgi:hypothetical protein